jgi:hypothetical protein
MPTWGVDNMDRLTELGLKYNTDKATGHGFTEFYYPYLEKYINPSILEIGIYDGASLKMWEEFYGNPSIIGVDILDKKQYDSQYTRTVIADQKNPKDILEKCTALIPEYDIIIDDGSHMIDHQISSFATLFPCLKSKGVYIIEDLHTSFLGKQYNPSGDPVTTYDFLYRIFKKFDVQTPFADEKQISYLAENFESAKIFQLHEKDFFHSITSVIVKK